MHIRYVVKNFSVEIYHRLFMVQIMHSFKNFVGWGLNRIFRMNK